MFNGVPINNPFSIGKLVGGLSKTLGVVNQVIPIYKEAKPLVQNAKNALSLIKEFSNTATDRVNKNKINNIEPIKEKINIIKNMDNKNISNKKGPTFFL